MKKVWIVGVTLSATLFLGGCNWEDTSIGEVVGETTQEETTTEEEVVEPVTEEIVDSGVYVEPEPALDIEPEPYIPEQVDIEPEPYHPPYEDYVWSGVSCSGFGSSMGAQQYLDYLATANDRLSLDPDGNGIACEGGGGDMGMAAYNPTGAVATPIWEIAGMTRAEYEAIHGPDQHVHTKVY